MHLRASTMWAGLPLNGEASARATSMLFEVPFGFDWPRRQSGRRSAAPTRQSRWEGEAGAPAGPGAVWPTLTPLRRRRWNPPCPSHRRRISSAAIEVAPQPEGPVDQHGLVDRARRGDRQAFAELIRASGARL